METPMQPREAARALLRSKAGYEAGEEDTTVCIYQEGRVSLPETTVGCPAASEILEGPAREMLVDFERRMLRKDEEFWEVQDNEGPLTPYMDKRLGSDRSAYAKFITDLHARGIIEYSRFALERSTVFLFARRTASLGWCLIVV